MNMKKQDEAYLKGWHDCMDAYANWKLDKQYIGMFETPLDIAKKGIEKCCLYNPPSKRS